MPFLWATFAASLAIGLEFAASANLNWWHNFWWVAPAALGVSFGVWQLLSTDFGWLPSMVLFGAVTATLRIGLAFGVTHEPLNAPNIIMTIVMIASIGFKLFWR